MLHRVDQRYVLVEDKIVIVGRAVGCYIPVKIPHCPVYRSHPVNAGLYLYSSHENLLFITRPAAVV
jgi:hypothetical protein